MLGVDEGLQEESGVEEGDGVVVLQVVKVSQGDLNPFRQPCFGQMSACFLDLSGGDGDGVDLHVHLLCEPRGWTSHAAACVQDPLTRRQLGCLRDMPEEVREIVGALRLEGLAKTMDVPIVPAVVVASYLSRAQGSGP